MGIETGIILAVATGLGTAAGSAIAGHEAASGAKDAAQTQADAATKAAQLQAASADKALALQRQQAEALYQSQETTRRANYGQYGAEQASQNKVRAMFGLAPIDVPDYVPGVDPGFSTAGGAVPATGVTPGVPPTSVTAGSAPSAGSAPAASGAPAGGNVQSALLAGLQSGKSGQSFVDQFNQQYGLQPGSSLAYYPGNNTYSIPSGYAAIGPDGKWGFNPRAGGGGTSGTASNGPAPIQVPSIASILAQYDPQGNALPPALAPSPYSGPQAVGAYL